MVVGVGFLSALHIGSSWDVTMLPMRLVGSLMEREHHPYRSSPLYKLKVQALRNLIVLERKWRTKLNVIG